MKKEGVSQKLLQLESCDVVRKWYKMIHDKELTIKRAMEINAAAKQSSEYLRNSKLSSYIVRPLLTFYSINSLSRAVILLFRLHGGENTLKSGHGLCIKSWNNILFKDDVQVGLSNLGELTITTCKGLFLELIDAIKNITIIHEYSDTVDWSINYDMLGKDIDITLNDLLSRIPDFENDLNNIDVDGNTLKVLELNFSQEMGFKCKAHRNIIMENELIKMGYHIKYNENFIEISSSSEFFLNKTPCFLHKYIDKTFGAIPVLYLSKPIHSIYSFSEISMCYMLGFILGMMVRYYPTHWNALISGSKGDKYWPIINKAQYYVEDVFPELIAELIDYKLKNN